MRQRAVEVVDGHSKRLHRVARFPARFPDVESRPVGYVFAAARESSQGQMRRVLVAPSLSHIPYPP